MSDFLVYTLRWIKHRTTLNHLSFFINLLCCGGPFTPLGPPFSMREFAEKFYKSKQWQKCRDGFTASKRGLCEECLKQGVYKPGVIVHHKVHLTPDNINDPTVSLDWDNLELLCRDHHALAHKPEKRYRVDELGRIISIGV